ncbi:hypothetical protein AVEN_105391-1 [Araneus ventricosus]|uniref:Uncharacterized protein n=1 Tax=Araneus ventricosus TaxID=182803 RepID=A0A4Y2JDB1_ARAVE|nr:hypothetical protein AVEN_259993-1 [Araneus ventricosus]GBM88291.1 hypothetical protein AVEN_105391-1 [Araneus ventricosus]
MPHLTTRKNTESIYAWYFIRCLTHLVSQVWDDELAMIAQKHAETCKFEHDCADCRRVGKIAFIHGHILGQFLMQLLDQNCSLPKYILIKNDNCRCGLDKGTVSHYIFGCNLYKEIRKKYFPTDFGTFGLMQLTANGLARNGLIEVF